MIFEHTCPVREGEDILTPPEWDDQRVKPWIDELVKHGVIDINGNMLRPATVKRGVGPKGYLFRLETFYDSA